MLPEKLAKFKQALQGGINLIPIGSRKKPLFAWKHYQTERITEEQLEEWARLEGVCGFAAIGGKISKGLVAIDFDAEGFYEKWCAQVGDIANSLPTQTTASGLYQVWFKTSLDVGNKELAYVPADNTTGRLVAIETKGEGGYAVMAPSYCPNASKNGCPPKPYKVIQGDFADLPTLSDEETQRLLDSARSLNLAPIPKQKMKAAPLPPRNGAGGVIGAFNDKYPVGVLLERHGYTPVGERYLAPDSTSGQAGVYIFPDSGCCYSHHANDVLNNGHRHDAFSVFCLLEHGGDVRVAVKAASKELGIWPEPEGKVPTQDHPNKPTLADVALPLEKFINLDMPPRCTLLHPWLQEASIGMIHSYRGVGKTNLGISIAEAVARGTAFGPWEAGVGARVLYLDAELPMQDASARILGLLKDFPQNFIFLSDHYASDVGLPKAALTDENWRQEFKKLLVNLRVKFWVADNIASLTPGIDENDKAAWDPVNQYLLELRFAGIASLLQHHSGKSGAQRGTSGREDNLDYVISLSRPKNYKLEDGCRFIASFEKSRVRQKDLFLISDTDFQLIENEDGTYIWTFTNARQKDKASILSLFNEGKTGKEIAESVGVTQAYVSKIKTKAISDGHLTEGGKLTPSGIVLVNSRLI